MKRVIKVRKLRNCIMSIFCVGLVSSQAFATTPIDTIDTILDTKLKKASSAKLSNANSKIVDISYQQQLSLNIADEAINRINFKHGRVSKIIGNVSGFTSILSDDGANLFISPKLPEKSKIDFAVLLASGDIIDISLTVVKSKKPYLISLNFDEHNQSAKSEVASLIEAMQDGVIGKYYVQKASSNVTISNQPKITATSSDIYRFGNLHGTTLTLTNKNKKSRNSNRNSKPNSRIEVTENDLMQAFRGVVGIRIANRYLAPTESTKAYIVFREAI
jgi:hypothetical protein